MPLTAYLRDLAIACQFFQKKLDTDSVMQSSIRGLELHTHNAQNLDLAPDGKCIVALMSAEIGKRKRRRIKCPSSKTCPTNCDARLRSANNFNRD